MNLSELISTIEGICHVTVSLEALDPTLRNCHALTLPHDQYLHHCDECRQFKLSNRFHTCTANKQRSVDIARIWKRPFSGFCPNHVWDLAVPVFFKQALVAIVYLGGLHAEPDMTRKRELRRYGQFIRDFITLELHRYVQTLTPHRKRRDAQFYLANALQFIEEKYSENISLEELAKLLNVNPEHLGKQITALTGKTFRQLLCERRLKQAEILVRLHHTQNVAQIAHLCGFSDSNYFSVVFKKHFGASPKAYRQQGDMPETQLHHTNFP